VSWSLWKTRNDWVFNDHLIKSPKVIAHNVMGFFVTVEETSKEEGEDEHGRHSEKTPRKTAGMMNLVI
jgi:hypothetical protein